MKTLHLFIMFIIVALAQLFIPAKMILGQEYILDTGKVYKFKTQPVDPRDPFRGKYITLRYDIESAETKDNSWKRDDTAYLYLNVDSLGFAKSDTISKQKLNIKKDFIKIKINRFDDKYWNKDTGYKVYFNLPFNRFYMEETKAKSAEDAYRKAQRDSLPSNIYGLVYIKEGEAVLEDVIVNDMSIAKYVEE